MGNDTVYKVHGKQWKLINVRNNLWHQHKIPCTLGNGELRVTIRNAGELDWFQKYCSEYKLTYKQE